MNTPGAGCGVVTVWSRAAAGEVLFDHLGFNRGVDVMLIPRQDQIASLQFLDRLVPLRRQHRRTGWEAGDEFLG
ncbi:MAG: hypothetical protein WD030_05135, partial [Pirellulales bacterium]